MPLTFPSVHICPVRCFPSLVFSRGFWPLCSWVRHNDHYSYLSRQVYLPSLSAPKNIHPLWGKVRLIAQAAAIPPGTMTAIRHVCSKCVQLAAPIASTLPRMQTAIHPVWNLSCPAFTVNSVLPAIHWSINLSCLTHCRLVAPCEEQTTNQLKVASFTIYLRSLCSLVIFQPTSPVCCDTLRTRHPFR